MNFTYSIDYVPPAPIMDIQLGVSEGAFTIGPLSVIVDTGADATIVPTRYIEQLDIPADDQKYLRGQWGERRIVDIYWVDIGIENLRLPLMETVADDLGNEVILGRNILNKLILLLNGPKNMLEVST